jgi:helix-turn-helix protein
MGDEGKLMTEQDAAQIVGVTVHALRAWRWRKKGGPAYLKLGSCVRYRLSDIQAYLDRHLVDPEAKPKIHPVRRHARRAA